MATNSAPSLVKVARAAGVAPSTASLALRGSTLVKPATIALVKAAAAKLGYLPDARVGSLMARIRRARPVKNRERLAFVWVGGTKAETKRDHFGQITLDGARKRAEEMGCALEEFWLDDGGMTAARLEKILVTRGITGVVFSAPLRDMEITIAWNWSQFAAAIIGNSEWHPPLHRAGHYHYRSMWTAMEKLRAAGCVRPAAILHEPHHQRIHGVHQAAFLANHPLPAKAFAMSRFGMPAVFPKRVGDNALHLVAGVSITGEREKERELRGWLAKNRADALIFVLPPSAEELRWLRTIPGLRAIVTLSSASVELPGIDMREDLIAASAVDLVLAQLHRNERGVPANPTTLLLEGEWRG